MRWEQGNFLVNRMPLILYVSSELFKKGHFFFFFQKGILNNIFEVVSYREKRWASCKQKSHCITPC